MNKRRNKTKQEVFTTVASTIMALIVAALLIMVLCGFVKYPEKYLSTWRYQLQNDIARGDEAAIEYYETNYVANGITLFGEE